VAYAATSLGLLKDNLLAVGRPGGERRTRVHKYEHLLGLVNIGTPMQPPHEDPQSSGHDRGRELSTTQAGAHPVFGARPLADCRLGYTLRLGTRPAGDGVER